LGRNIFKKTLLRGALKPFGQILEELKTKERRKPKFLQTGFEDRNLRINP